MLILRSESAEHTMRIAKDVGGSIKGGEWVCLYGTIGAGKTTFVKGLAQGLGVSEHVQSPTFTLMNRYETGRIPICHIDAYRMANAREIEDTGVLDYFDDCIVVVEWAELLEDSLADIEEGKRINVVLEHEGPLEGRTIRIVRR